MEHKNFLQNEFLNLCEKYKNEQKERDSIGLLKEKTLHAVLKDFVCMDKTCQEIKIGRYVADVFKDEHITEIQTNHLFTLHKKLQYFLSLYKVTVVYPISQTKWIYWADPETGLLEKPHKSTRQGTFQSALAQLAGLSDYLGNPNLEIKIMLLETEEYRVRDGFGKNNTRRATKTDIFPVRLIDTMTVTSIADLYALLPLNLPSEFTVPQLGKAIKLTGRNLYWAKGLLLEKGIIRETIKKGRAMNYEIVSLKEVTGV
ncbi:MAG: hypothetical protein RR902_00630 [Oscillospiraceae bacterium]